MKPQDLPRIAETSTETADKMLFESAMSQHQGVTSQFSAGIEYRVQTGEAVVGIWDAAKRVGTIFDTLEEAKNDDVKKAAEVMFKQIDDDADKVGAKIIRRLDGSLKWATAFKTGEKSYTVVSKFESDLGDGNISLCTTGQWGIQFAGKGHGAFFLGDTIEAAWKHATTKLDMLKESNNYDFVFMGAKVEVKGNAGKGNSKEPLVVVKIVDDQRVVVKDDYGQKQTVFIKDLVPAVVEEAIKGWKHAGSDLTKMRRDAREGAMAVKMVTLRKDGQESGMHDAASKYDSVEAARKRADDIAAMNPGRTFNYNVYVDGKLTAKFMGADTMVQESTELDEVSDMTRKYAGFKVLNTATNKTVKYPYRKGVASNDAEDQAIRDEMKATGLPRKSFMIDGFVEKGGLLGESSLDEGKFILKSKDGVEKKFAKSDSADAVAWMASIQKKPKPEKTAKAPTVKTETLSLTSIFMKVMEVVSNIYPDGDPIDHIGPWCKKVGISYDMVTKACKANGYKDLYDYWNSMEEVTGESRDLDEAAAKKLVPIDKKEYDAIAAQHKAAKGFYYKDEINVYMKDGENFVQTYSHKSHNLTSVVRNGANDKHFKYVDESTDQKKDKLIKPVTDKSEGDAIPAALEEATVPKITVEQGSVKADGKFVDMKFERVGSKMFLMIGDPKNDRERMAVPADQASYPDYIEWLKANWVKANDLLATLGESKEQGDDAMLYEFTGGGVVVDKNGAVKKDGKPVALKFEKLKGKLWLLVGDGDGDQDRLEVPDAQSGDMAAAVDWLVMSWKTVMKILATNNMQEGLDEGKESIDIGAGVWRVTHHVQIKMKGHKLNGWSGVIIDAGDENGQVLVKGDDGKQLSVSSHDIAPATGWGWPDLDTYKQPSR